MSHELVVVTEPHLLQAIQKQGGTLGRLHIIRQLTCPQRFVFLFYDGKKRAGRFKTYRKIAAVNRSNDRVNPVVTTVRGQVFYERSHWVSSFDSFPQQQENGAGHVRMANDSMRRF